MNWDNIKVDFPYAYRLLGAEQNIYAFFDAHRIVVVPTYTGGRRLPWGWEVHIDFTEISCPAKYSERAKAENEAFGLAFAELNKRILAGNA